MSACATCDGFFFRNQDVAVIGGGNTAVEEALYLSNIARNVTLVHRRDKLRAEKIMQDKLFARSAPRQRAPAVEPRRRRGLGDGKGVTGVRCEHERPGGRRTSLSRRFIAIGHTPNTTLFEGQLEMRNGYILVRAGSEGGATATSVPGVFAAGDVADHVYRQAVTSRGLGLHGRARRREVSRDYREALSARGPRCTPR